MSKHNKARSKSEINTEEMEKMVRDINKGKEIDVKQAFKLIFLTLYEIKNEKQITEIEKKIKSAEKRCEEIKKSKNDLKKKLNMLEAKNYQNKVIIKNLSLHSKSKKAKAEETISQQHEVGQNLISMSGLSMESIEDCYRFKKKNEANDSKPPHMVIHFSGRANLIQFMSGLKNIKKKSRTKFIEVDQLIPPSLKKMHEAASLEAFKLRKLGKKTKVILSSLGEIILFSKQDEKSNYERTNFLN